MEDEKLFSQEAQNGGGESGQAPEEAGSLAVTLPARPVPVHRMQVPPQAVGDLLMVWDFLKVRVRTSRTVLCLTLPCSWVPASR